MADTPYTTDPNAANGVWTVGNAPAPSNFAGYDNQAHAGVTFNAEHPESGAKYVVQNYLQQNHIDPNTKDWGTGAAADLNKLYGKTDLFKSVTGPDGTSRLTYGDESVGSGGDSGGGDKGKFTWTGNGGPGGGQRPQLNLPTIGGLFNSQPASNMSPGGSPTFNEHGPMQPIDGQPHVGYTNPASPMQLNVNNTQQQQQALNNAVNSKYKGQV